MKHWVLFQIKNRIFQGFSWDGGGGRGRVKFYFSLNQGVLLYYIKFPIFIVSKKVALGIYHCRHSLDLCLISLFLETENSLLLQLLVFCLVTGDTQVREHLRSCLEEAKENRSLGLPILLRESHQRDQ